MALGRNRGTRASDIRTNLPDQRHPFRSHRHRVKLNSNQNKRHISTESSEGYSRRRATGLQEILQRVWRFSRLGRAFANREKARCPSLMVLRTTVFCHRPCKRYPQLAELTSRQSSLPCARLSRSGL